MKRFVGFRTQQDPNAPKVEFEKVYPEHRYNTCVYPGPEGYCAGERCNRKGCHGIITEHDLEGCCSCHISPPCSWCETSKAYCPECDWDALEEEREWEAKKREENDKWLKSPEGLAFAEKLKQERIADAAENKLFWEMYRGIIRADKPRFRSEGHTHFSMKWHGVFPPTEGVNEGNVISWISSQPWFQSKKGTFGGRFERCTTFSFTYIAYTD